MPFIDIFTPHRIAKKESMPVRSIGLGKSFESKMSNLSSSNQLPHDLEPNLKNWYGILSTNENTDDSFTISSNKPSVDGYIVGVGFGGIFRMLDLIPQQTNLPKAIISCDIIPNVVLAGRLAVKLMAKAQNLEHFLKSTREVKEEDLDTVIAEEPNAVIANRLLSVKPYVQELFRTQKFPVGKGTLLNRNMIEILMRNYDRIHQLAKEGNIGIVLSDITSNLFLSQVEQLDRYNQSRNIMYVSNVIDHITSRGQKPDFRALESLATLDTNKGTVYVDTTEQVLHYLLRVGNLPPIYSEDDFPRVYRSDRR